MECSDLNIIIALHAGERWAFYELYQRYSEIIYRNILVRVNSSFDADDIFQDFFIQLWEKRENLKVETNVRAYLLVWLKNHILNTIKENQIREKYQTIALQNSEEADDYTWVKIVSEDLRIKLTKTVETFPPRLKTVYILSREQHLTVKEIAEKLNVSEQTIKNQLTEILRRLKNEMNRKNFIFFA